MGFDRHLRHGLINSGFFLPQLVLFELGLTPLYLFERLVLVVCIYWCMSMILSLQVIRRPTLISLLLSYILSFRSKIWMIFTIS